MRNRIRRLLGRQHGWAMPQVSDLFSKKGMAALGALPLSAPDDLLLRQQMERLDRLARHIRKLDEIIASEGKTDEAVGRLATIPEIRPILGNVIATEIDAIDRFASSEQLCAYVGLVPTTSSSGDKTYYGRLVSGCNKWLRWALVEAAWVAVGCDAYFGGFYRHHRARGKKANTAIMMTAWMCQIAYRVLHKKRANQTGCNEGTKIRLIAES